MTTKRTNWKSRATTLSVVNALLQEEIDTLRGLAKPYRLIEQATGRIRDFDTAQQCADHLFAVGGFHARQRFWLYKNERAVMQPLTGDVDELARMLEAA